ncbi:MAG: hypothetical protein MJ247_01115 [Alphaproteobacteria bacterium]|nr:hypothetical protein [Alphaproteobacteria bacterium]
MATGLEMKDDEIVVLKDEELSSIAAGDEIGRNILLDDISLDGFAPVSRDYLSQTSTN